jgi:Sulfatase-modifying factor enzyme 1/TIR domain
VLPDLGRFELFLSYVRDDRARADRVVDELARHGMRCWWDKIQDIRMDETRWTDEIEKRVSECDAFLLLLTDNLVHRGRKTECYAELRKAEALGKHVYVLSCLPVDKIDRASYWWAHIDEGKYHVDEITPAFFQKLSHFLAKDLERRLDEEAIDLRIPCQPDKLLSQRAGQAAVARVPPEIELVVPSPGRAALPVSVHMLFVPAGRFKMGSRKGGEAPRHERRIRRPFLIGAHLVSNDLWSALSGGTLGEIGRGDRPRTGVSRSDAESFCKLITAKSGIAFSLPTEAQWEYAARFFLAAHGLPAPRMNVSTPAATAESQSVGNPMYEACGLVHMLGECWEWVQDDYQESYQQVPDDETARCGSAVLGVVRGGSRSEYEHDVTVTVRRKVSPHERDKHIGFRFVASIDSKSLRSISRRAAS